jgi:ribose 5-phosphate isomerase A
MNKFDELKKRAAERAIEYVVDGNVVGLGTGSTAKFAIEGSAGESKKDLLLLESQHQSPPRASPERSVFPLLALTKPPLWTLHWTAPTKSTRLSI